MLTGRLKGQFNATETNEREKRAGYQELEMDGIVMGDERVGGQ